MTFTEHVHLTSLFIFKLMLNAHYKQSRLFILHEKYIAYEDMLFFT